MVQFTHYLPKEGNIMNKKLQVFVSSTYTDLKEERQAAVEAILDAGHIPAGMELFKAGKSQMQTIQKWIDESDVYMLILGGRYGSIEEDSGLSYTELEYKYALSKNMPVFSVVLSETFLKEKINILKLSDVMEQKAPDKYQTFKSLVMSKIVCMVDDCKDIKIAIHSTLDNLITEYDFIGWIRNNSKNRAIREKIYINHVTTLQNLISELENIELNLNNISELIDGKIKPSNTIDLLAYTSVIHKQNMKNIGKIRTILSKNRFEMQKYENEMQKLLNILEKTSLQIFSTYQSLDYYKGVDVSILNVLTININIIKSLLFNLIDLCKTDLTYC